MLESPLQGEERLIAVGGFGEGGVNGVGPFLVLRVGAVLAQGVGGRCG